MKTIVITAKKENLIQAVEDALGQLKLSMDSGISPKWSIVGGEDDLPNSMVRSLRKQLDDVKSDIDSAIYNLRNIDMPELDKLKNTHQKPTGSASV